MDDDLPIEVVRAVHYTDTGTYAIKPKRSWETTVLPAGVLRLRAAGAGDRPSRVVGRVGVAAVAEANASRDLVRGILLTRPQLEFQPSAKSFLDGFREPHIELPGVDQRFREYTLLRFLDHFPNQIDAWAPSSSSELETIHLWLWGIEQKLEGAGLAATEQAQEIRQIGETLREAQAKAPRFLKRALQGAAIAIVAKLGVLAVDPLLVEIATSIQQLTIEVERFIERFF